MKEGIIDFKNTTDELEIYKQKEFIETESEKMVNDLVDVYPTMNTVENRAALKIVFINSILELNLAFYKYGGKNER